MHSTTVTCWIAFLALLSVTCAQQINYDGFWSPRTPMPTPRSDLAATVINDFILLTGGCSQGQICPDSSPVCICPNITNVVEAYYPNTDKWQSFEPMPHARYRHGSEVINNKLYIFGGRDINDSFIREVDVYDVHTAAWTTLPDEQSMPIGNSDFSSFVFDNTIYAVGGYTVDYSPLASSISFSPASSSSPVWNANALPPMAFPRGDTCAARIDDRIYLFGGFDELDACVALDQLEIYDFSERKWNLGESMPIRGGDKACGQLLGRFHVFGGEQKDSPTNCSKYSTPLDDVQGYDPADRTWRVEPSMPKPRFRFISIYFRGNHEALYTFGGQADYDTKTKSYPVVDTVQVWSDYDFSASSLISPIHIAVYFLILLWISA